MKFNKIRFYLHNYENIQKEIDLIQKRVSELLRYDNINTTIQLREFISSSNQTTSNVETNAIERLEMIEKLNKKINELKNIKLAIDSTKIYLSEIDKKIINMRYNAKQGQPINFEYIAKKVNYSSRYVKKRENSIVTQIRDNYLNLI